MHTEKFLRYIMLVRSFVYFITTNFNNHLVNNVLDPVYKRLIKVYLLMELKFM